MNSEKEGEQGAKAYIRSGSHFAQPDCQSVYQEPCTEVLCNCAAQEHTACGVQTKAIQQTTLLTDALAVR